MKNIRIILGFIKTIVLERNISRRYFFLIVCVMILSSCNKYEDIQKYQRPEWLVGKIFTQIDQKDSLSLFAECMVDVGYDKVVDKTGTYSAFVPNNIAMQEYLNKNSFASIEDIPLQEKENLVKSHIIQMPWAQEQLRGLSSKGWINVNDPSNNEPLAFKRQTLLKNENRKYNVVVEYIEGERFAVLVDDGIPFEDTRVVFSNSRKYAPLFYDGYMSAMQLTSGDFQFYFGRPYEPNNIYYAGAKVSDEEYYADNGFVYVIDKVIDPLLNAEELMEVNGYSNFKQLIYQFSEFIKNDQETEKKQEANPGEETDDLYNLTYDRLAFDIHQEMVGSKTRPNLTYEYHNGIVVPDNQAFDKFINETFLSEGRWSRFELVPANTKRVIVNAHMSTEPFYKNVVTEGFINYLGDKVQIEEKNIIEKAFGSNCTFIGVNEVVLPKAFTSVSAPLFFYPDYETFLTAYDKTDVLGFLKNELNNFSLFLIDDASIGVNQETGDQSLYLQWLGWRKEKVLFKSFLHEEEKEITLGVSEISPRIYGQTGIQPLLGQANIEFIETIDGRHIHVDNENKTITGGVPSEFGWDGTEERIVKFEEIGAYNNGKAFKTNGWLSFTDKIAYSVVSNNSKFMDLLIKAGLADNYSLLFSKPSERYTIFMPSEEAIEEANLDSLSKNELIEVLGYHIVSNKLIFTDGRQPSGEYKTLNTNKNMTIYSQPDIISVKLSDETNYDISLDKDKTNIIGTVKGVNNYAVTKIVAHKIDTVLN